MTLLVLSCLVALEQAQPRFGINISADTGMSVSEHYTVSADTLRLRQSREADVIGGGAPDSFVVSSFDSPRAYVDSACVLLPLTLNRVVSGCPVVVSARAPPAANTASV